MMKLDSMASCHDAGYFVDGAATVADYDEYDDEYGDDDVESSCQERETMKEMMK